MTAILQIMTDAMVDIGALAIEETPSNAEAQSCLRALNNMIDTWNNESLIIYDTAPHTFAYVANQQSYTYGTSGDFNGSRPITITQALNRQYAGTANEVDYPMYVTNNSNEYAEIITKRIATTLPTVMYYDGGYPLQTCYFWPVPSGTTYAPVLWTWEAISSFATINDTVTLPPGYQRALQKNLAIEIAPSFSAPISQNLQQQAVESKAQLKRVNYRVDELNMPFGIPGAGVIPALPQFLQGK